jgi:hypothetical protein
MGGGRIDKINVVLKAWHHKTGDQLLLGCDCWIRQVVTNGQWGMLEEVSVSPDDNVRCGEGCGSCKHGSGMACIAKHCALEQNV